MGLPRAARNPIVTNMIPRTARTPLLPAFGWIAAACVLLGAAWLLPVNLNSITPAVLTAAGERSMGVAELGQQLLDEEKPGPAALVRASAAALEDPRTAELTHRLQVAAQRQPELVPWGGWDPFLDPLFNLQENTGRTESTPVLTFFITREARDALRGYLVNSRSQGVQALLATAQLERTLHFVPATRPGGQALDAVILLTALLYQGEHFSASLQRELRTLAETASGKEDPTELELFYLDVLSLGRRLDWTQLVELMRRSESVRTVGEFAHLSRAAADDLPHMYAAALLMNSADPVAAYLLRFGRAGVEDLSVALSHGQGAVRQLLQRQVPINRGAGPALGAAAELGILHPGATLVAKYVGFLLGSLLLFRGLEQAVRARIGPAAALPRMSSGVLALLSAALLVLATEPFLLKAAPVADFQVQVTVPVLADLSDPDSLQSTPATLAMDSRTILSIVFFAALQIGMYLICLLKIGEVARQDLPALVKLKLMENEENLFDGGLYVGIGGTAAALVLQVLGFIEPNLLAAYSSNLFGITCVALVKIRHVRPYKYRLIMESQSASPVMVA